MRSVFMQKELQQLDGKEKETRARLSEARNRYRTLRHQRHTLLSRSKAAETTVSPLTPLADPHCHPPVATISTTPEDTPTTTPAISGATSAAKPHQTASEIHGGDCNRDNRVVSTRAAHSGNFFTEYDELPRPISSFAHCAGLCYDYVAPFLPPHGSWAASDSNTVSAAISSYQNSVSQRVSKPLGEICWFNQMCYEVAPQLRISHSAGACILLSAFCFLLVDFWVLFSVCCFLVSALCSVIECGVDAVIWGFSRSTHAHAYGIVT
jgi:hypothetical protein